MTDERIINTYNQFKKIVEWNSGISSIKVSEPDNFEGAQGFSMYHCSEKVESLLNQPETAFLALSVIEQYWNAYKPSIVIPYSDIKDNNTSKFDDINLLETELKDNPAKDRWEEISEQFKNAMVNWYEMNDERLSDLPAISHIIYDALLYKGNKHQKTYIYSLCKGKRSENEPVLLPGIAIFGSEAEAMHTLMNFKSDAFIGFFAVERKYKDTEDKFHCWLYNCESSRKRNIMDMTRMSSEEYDESVDPYSRNLYCVIRNGENLSIFHPRKETAGYESSWKKANYYGRRMSYAPIQIFFEDAPATSETMALTYPKKRVWDIREILDEEQKIWLPVFFMSVKRDFFGEDCPDMIDVILPEELLVTHTENGQIVPLHYLDNIRDTFRLPEPKEIFTEENGKLYGEYSMSGNEERFGAALELCSVFGITSDDILDAPTAFPDMAERERVLSELNRRVIKSYYKVIEERIKIVFENELLLAHQWYRDKVKENHDEIMRKAISREYRFATTRVHKRPVLNEDGSPKMVKRFSYSNEMFPVYEETTIDEGKPLHNDLYREIREWYPGDLKGKHPPVAVVIHPASGDDIAELSGVEKDNLPFILKYYDILPWFQGFVSRYNTFGSIDADIRFLFSKTEYKKRINAIGAEKK